MVVLLCNSFKICTISRDLCGKFIHLILRKYLAIIINIQKLSVAWNWFHSTNIFTQMRLTWTGRSLLTSINTNGPWTLQINRKLYRSTERWITWQESVILCYSAPCSFYSSPNYTEELLFWSMNTASGFYTR